MTYPAQFDFAATLCLLQRNRKGLCHRSTEPRLAHLLLSLLSDTHALQSRMILTASNACAAHTCRQCSQAHPLKPLRVHTIQHIRRRASRSRQGHVTQMGLKAVETFNASFELQPEAETALHQLLASQAFCKQVVKECQLEEGSEVKFSGRLFQPVPWSEQVERACLQILRNTLTTQNSQSSTSLQTSCFRQRSSSHQGYVQYLKDCRCLHTPY